MGFSLNFKSCFTHLPSEVSDVFSKNCNKRDTKILLVASKALNLLASASLIGLGATTATIAVAAMAATPIGVSVLAVGVALFALGVLGLLVGSSVLGRESRNLANEELRAGDQREQTTNREEFRGQDNSSTGNERFQQQREPSNNRERFRRENSSSANSINSKPTRSDHLKVLDLPETATKEEIRKKYLTLCKSEHPDRVYQQYKESNEEVKERALLEAKLKFQAIKDAYDALKAK